MMLKFKCLLPMTIVLHKHSTQKWGCGLQKYFYEPKLVWSSELIYECTCVAQTNARMRLLHHTLSLRFEFQIFNWFAKHFDWHFDLNHMIGVECFWGEDRNFKLWKKKNSTDFLKENQRLQQQLDQIKLFNCFFNSLIEITKN